MVTVFTTKANHPRFLETCPHGSISIIDLKFPSDVEGVPQGIESTDKLPSIALFRQLAVATKLMQPQFEQYLDNLPNVTCIISDSFLSWTLASANKFGIPRLSFYGMNAYATALSRDVGFNFWGPESDDELITVPGFTWIKVTRNDFDKPFNQRDPTGSLFDFVRESIIATENSYDLIMNSFYELEPLFIDYLNREIKTKIWCVGPLCLVEAPATTDNKQTRDLNPTNGSHIQGFGAIIVSFLWVVRKGDQTGILDELEQRVGERGMIKQLVNRMEILNHKSVNGFVSDCSWNSVLESICSGVPILAWPMMAEQHLNARMVVEEIKIGLRVETCNGSVKGFVKPDGLKMMVKELMEGEKGKEVRKKVKEVGAAPKRAIADDGSSWRTLNKLINELQTDKTFTKSE
ncbi:hypothetical protein R6Q57_005390 [Mikania cordata]